MKESYKDFNFRKASLQQIALINAMVEDYTAQGFKLSVRQLYYQLVARGYIENTERSYKNTAALINDARLAGMLDWDAIEDRNRDIAMRTRWLSGAQIVEAAARSFHMDMWAGQDARVFAIVEKAALAGILEGVCREYDVPLLAARGYPSVSIVREMVEEHILPSLDEGQEVVVLHMGDHDPSGIDMTRDLAERFEMFARTTVHVKRIALNMPQIEEKNPPPNPAKATDSRFQDYRRKFGDESWELDALDPSYLVNLITNEINNYRDEATWDERFGEVEEIREMLKDSAARFEDQPRGS